MTDTAIVYFSSLGGHVEKTAQYIAEQLGADTFDLKKQTDIDLSGYSRVIVGTGIHAGKPYAKALDFARNNRAALSGKKTSLFICCLYKGERGGAQCERISKEFGIPDASYFPDSGEKNEDGVKKEVASFVARMKA